jgi:hypothetical protein
VITTTTGHVLSNREVTDYHEVIRERLGIDCAADPDPLIDMPRIARLAGVQPGTVKQWRNRTRLGQARHPFPEPPPGTGDRFQDKPLWHAVSQVIPFLEASGNWPPETGARPATRGPRQRDEAA